MEESIEELEKIAVRELCGDLMEEVYDGENLVSELGRIGERKTNKSGAKSLKRKTCRVKLFKQSSNVEK